MMDKTPTYFDEENEDFTSGTEPDDGGRYITLSTCAYAFTDARYVLHGRLVPVGDAAGSGAGAAALAGQDRGQRPEAAEN